MSNNNLLSNTGHLLLMLLALFCGLSGIVALVWLIVIGVNWIKILSILGLVLLQSFLAPYILGFALMPSLLLAGLLNKSKILDLVVLFLTNLYKISLISFFCWLIFDQFSSFSSAASKNYIPIHLAGFTVCSTTIDILGKDDQDILMQISNGITKIIVFFIYFTPVVMSLYNIDHILHSFILIPILGSFIQTIIIQKINKNFY